MNYKKKIKRLVGPAMSKQLAYLSRVLHHDSMMAGVIKKLSDNKKLYGIHQGERCFILGNGPSLKEVSMKQLEDEWVFTVNYFNKIANYKAAKTNYHVWSDAVFFDMRSDMHADMKEVMECYDMMCEENAEYFFPTYAYKYLKTQKLLGRMDPYFFCSYDIVAKETKLKMDISNFITEYFTVVQYVITIAIYMGFSEIYLLGCDSTYLLGVFDKLLKVKSLDIHAYNSDNAGKEIEEILKNHPISEVLYDQYLMFLGYEKLYEYCKEKNIALFNCSAQTVVTSIPRIDLDKVLFGK